MKKQPVVLIDDDIDDFLVIRAMATAIYFPNPVVAFTDPVAALDFLAKSSEPPLLVLSDLNMPKLNGFQLRMKMLELHRPAYDTIPFIILSTSKTDDEVLHAKKLDITAFYKKEDTFEGLRRTLQKIKTLLISPV